MNLQDLDDAYEDIHLPEDWLERDLERMQKYRRMDVCMIVKERIREQSIDAPYPWERD